MTEKTASGKANFKNMNKIKINQQQIGEGGGEHLMKAGIWIAYRKSQKKTWFAHTWVSNKQKLEQIVTAEENMKSINFFEWQICNFV